MTAKCLTTSQERQDFDTQDFVHPGLLSPTLTAANNPSRSPQSSEVTAQVEATAGAGAGVRRLTPTECERLQGFPDGWTIPDNTDWREHPKPDGPRYAQMGNAVTVHCAHWLGERLKPELEAALSEYRDETEGER